jgi:hypothetical protein
MDVPNCYDFHCPSASKRTLENGSKAFAPRVDSDLYMVTIMAD